MKIFYALILLTVLISPEAKSQAFSSSVGLRMGSCGGLTYRRIMDYDLAGEIQLSGYHHSMILTFLVEKHRPMLIHDHYPFTLLYGAGVHVGAGPAHHNRDWNNYNNYDHYNSYPYSPKAGIDGFAAIEYELNRYPVAVSLECKPFIEFFDYGFPGLHIPAIAFAVRYLF